jgi:hypothetical protein
MAIFWHRIFGMALTQYFAGSRWKVEVETDLSVQQQKLDIAIVFRDRAGNNPDPIWPDGIGEPARFNLFTFRGLKQVLSAEVVKEVVAHSVTYRKWVSPSPDELLPAADFRIFAASMHHPELLKRELADRNMTLQKVDEGAYDLHWAIDRVRILVMREMPEKEQNIVWNLFSNHQPLIANAFATLKKKYSNQSGLGGWSAILNTMLEHYGLEGMTMPYTMEQFEKDVEEQFLAKLTPEKLLAKLTPEKILAKLTPEQRLAGLAPEQVASSLAPEQAACLSLEQRLAGLSRKELDDLEKLLKERK